MIQEQEEGRFNSCLDVWAIRLQELHTDTDLAGLTVPGPSRSKQGQAKEKKFFSAAP